MKVAFDARYLNGPVSGIGTYKRNLLQELLALDPSLELVLVTRKPGLAASFDAERCTDLVFNVEPRSLRTIVGLPLRLRGLGVQLFHGPFNILPSNLPVPSVVTLHDIMQLQNPANISRQWSVQWTAGLFWRERIKHAIHHATRICTVSNATRDAILERFEEVDPQRIVVTPLAVDPELCRAIDLAEAHQRVAAATGHSGPFVLSVGNESPHKNHHRAIRAFLEAFPERDDLKLVIVRRLLRHDTRLLALLADEAVQRRVILLDAVDGETLRALYSTAELFFFPSWVEGFGLPILEAMACDCPVVTSDRSAPAEVAGDAALTVSPFDVPAMARALREAMAPARRKALVTAGRQHQRTFQWRSCGEATLRAYAEAVG